MKWITAFTRPASGAAVVAALLVTTSCDSLVELDWNDYDEARPGVKSTFPMVRAGTGFVYDYVPVGEPRTCYETVHDSTDGALVISCLEASTLLSIRLSYPRWDCIAGLVSANGQLGGMSLSIQRRDDGLYRSHSEPWGSLFPSYYLRVPYEPRLGQRIDRFGLIVTDVRNRLTVPAGTYEVFVLEGANGREYWSRDVGLVRIDRFDDNGTLTGYYELSEVRR